jgi:hypothetical protein
MILDMEKMESVETEIKEIEAKRFSKESSETEAP